jgi:YD repeat-containing protein
MQYNDRGLVTKVTNPDATFRTRTYTTYGDLASETNELGHTWTVSVARSTPLFFEGLV